MSVDRAPRVIPPPTELEQLGPLVVVEGDCAYFHDGRATCTAFSLPGHLSGADYQQAMNLGMRRSGTVVYRPLCDECRLCQPLRVPVRDFKPSKSMRRARRKIEGRFKVEVGRPQLNAERLDLYARYQDSQHGEHAQSADEKSYRRFLVDTITDTIEITWRNRNGTLMAVGVLDVTPDALSSVYFYWDPSLRGLSIGTSSAMVEIELCQTWGKRYYYLGYLVAGSKTMSYKAGFPGAEVWEGTGWTPIGGRDITEKEVATVLRDAELRTMVVDDQRFRLSVARTLPVVNDDVEPVG